MKKYYMSYSYFENQEDEDNDLLSYGYLIFQVANCQEAFDSLYSYIESGGGIMAAVYSITIE